MPNVLPRLLYRAEQVRALDRAAIDRFGIPGMTLMERAGLAAFNRLRDRWPEVRRITVVCGTGNNGGDGYVIARLAHEAGLGISLLHVGDRERLQGEAVVAAEAAERAGVPMAPFTAGGLAGSELLVDALLGTGLKGEVSGVWCEAITAMNAVGVPVLAVDIPSGLDADTGAVLGAAVRADLTVTFIGLKQGLFTGDAPDHTGEILFDALDLPAAVYEQVPPSAKRIDSTLLGGPLAPRRRTAHKGAFGHVLVVGGERGMAGAVRMAAEAAARVGAGLVSVATRPGNAAALTAARPELMCHEVSSPADLGPLLRRATVVAVGPGLGIGDWGRALFGHLLEVPLPLVVDADALNLLALEPAFRTDWVLTPHPGEAARLLGSDVAAIQRDRFAAATSLRDRFGGVMLLKGAGTLVCDMGGTALIGGGNPGMASGGMGDVLTGVIAGLVAQGIEPGEAASLGACLHAAAGDRAAAAGERGMLATDLLPHLRRLANP